MKPEYKKTKIKENILLNEKILTDQGFSNLEETNIDFTVDCSGLMSQEYFIVILHPDFTYARSLLYGRFEISLEQQKTIVNLQYAAIEASCPIDIETGELSLNYDPEGIEGIQNYIYLKPYKIQGELLELDRRYHLTDKDKEVLHG